MSDRYFAGSGFHPESEGVGPQETVLLYFGGFVAGLSGDLLYRRVQTSQLRQVPRGSCAGACGGDEQEDEGSHESDESDEFRQIPL